MIFLITIEFYDKPYVAVLKIILIIGSDET